VAIVERHDLLEFFRGFHRFHVSSAQACVDLLSVLMTEDLANKRVTLIVFQLFADVVWLTFSAAEDQKRSLQEPPFEQLMIYHKCF
jgi:hypothetical protein